MRIGIRIGKPLDFSRYEGMEDDRFVLRSITDEIMYELMLLSGQEYVDMYATSMKDRLVPRPGPRPRELQEAAAGPRPPELEEALDAAEGLAARREPRPTTVDGDRPTTVDAAGDERRGQLAG